MGCVLHTDACGGYIDGTNGTLTSPFYPSIYPPNKNCVWLIVAPPQHRITVTFTHFDVEGNNVRVNYSAADKGAEYCDERVCLCVCVCVCLLAILPCSTELSMGWVDP